MGGEGASVRPPRRGRARERGVAVSVPPAAGRGGVHADARQSPDPPLPAHHRPGRRPVLRERAAHVPDHLRPGPRRQRLRVALGRIGDPFIAALAEYITWDDRGAVSAMWRYRPKAKRARPAEIAFHFEFVVECPTDEAAGLAGNPDSLAAVRRQADWVFPPFAISVWIDENLEPIARKFVEVGGSRGTVRQADSAGRRSGLQPEPRPVGRPRLALPAIRLGTTGGTGAGGGRAIRPRVGAVGRRDRKSAPARPAAPTPTATHRPPADWRSSLGFRGRTKPPGPRSSGRLPPL